MYSEVVWVAEFEFEVKIIKFETTHPILRKFRFFLLAEYEFTVKIANAMLGLKIEKKKTSTLMFLYENSHIAQKYLENIESIIETFH